MEVSIPLAGGSAARSSEPKAAADPLDVQAAVEKIAGAAGLKPEAQNTAESDLFSMVDDTINTSSANTRTWKHPAYPVFLSMTRHEGEFVLLLNYAPEGKANSNATKLYKSLEQQLSELPVRLVTPKTKM